MPTKTDSDDPRVTWQKLRAWGSNTRSIQFVDVNTGYAADYGSGGGDNTASGRIWKTTNAGHDWQAVLESAEVPFSTVHFVNAKLGFAAGGRDSCGGSNCKPPGSRVFRTENGGTSWTLVFSSPSADGDTPAIDFADELHGLLVNARQSYRTTDGGKTWQPVTGVAGASVRFCSPQVVVAGGRGLFKSIDGGATWTAVSLPLSYVLAVDCTDDQSWFAADQQTVVVSNNAGAKWTAQQLGYGHVSAITHADADTIFIVGGGGYSGGDFGHSLGRLAYSFDKGATWTTHNNLAMTALNGISFPTSTIGYAGGPGGLKIFLGGAPPPVEARPEDFDLFQCSVVPNQLQVWANGSFQVRGHLSNRGTFNRDDLEKLTQLIRRASWEPGDNGTINKASAAIRTGSRVLLLSTSPGTPAGHELEAFCASLFATYGQDASLAKAGASTPVPFDVVGVEWGEHKHFYVTWEGKDPTEPTGITADELSKVKALVLAGIWRQAPGAHPPFKNDPWFALRMRKNEAHSEHIYNAEPASDPAMKLAAYLKTLGVKYGR